MDLDCGVLQVPWYCGTIDSGARVASNGVDCKGHPFHSYGKLYMDQEGPWNTPKAKESLRDLSTEVIHQIYDLVKPLGIVNNMAIRGISI